MNIIRRRTRGILIVIKELIVSPNLKEGTYIWFSFIQSNTRATIIIITITIIAFNIQTSLPTFVITRFRGTFLTIIITIISATGKITGRERIVFGSGGIDIGIAEFCLRLWNSSCQANEGCQTENDGGAHIKVSKMSEVMEEK